MAAQVQCGDGHVGQAGQGVGQRGLVGRIGDA